MKQGMAVEEYLIDLINQKYAKRVFQKMNTEWERLTIEHGSEPGVKEYDWMVKKAMEIHRDLNVSGPGEKEKIP
jgi:hypothetical protein